MFGVPPKNLEEPAVPDTSDSRLAPKTKSPQLIDVILLDGAQAISRFRNECADWDWMVVFPTILDLAPRQAFIIAHVLGSFPESLLFVLIGVPVHGTIE